MKKIYELDHMIRPIGIIYKDQINASSSSLGQ